MTGRFIFGFALAVVATLAVMVPVGAQGLLKNADFTATDDKGILPGDWQVAPADAPRYRAVNDDGYSGSHSVHYVSDGAATSGPLTQIATCKANTSYILSAALKSDGTLRPVISVYARGGNVPLASITSDGSRTWQVFKVDFSSGTATELEARVYGDGSLVRGATSAAGLSAIDDVQVTPAAATAEADTVPTFTPPGPNLARSKPYTLQPAPNYQLCTDPGDLKQLTDGIYTTGYFWTQNTTVGWSNANPVVITIDLQRVQPIAGLSYSTAAGVAGVTWPNSILVMVSDNGEQWSLAGDLVALSNQRSAPPTDAYTTWRFQTDQLTTRGRYVKLYVDGSPFVFVDEIEVYRGPDTLLAQTPGQIVDDPNALFDQRRIYSGILWRLRTDLQAVKAAITASKLPMDEQADLLAQADALAPEISNLPQEIPADFTTRLPLNDLEARIFALYAPLHRAKGLQPLTAWVSGRWDPLEPTEAPEPGNAPELTVQMMRNESRGAAFNLTNATGNAIRLTLMVTGLPGGNNPDYVRVCEVPFTDTREHALIASALPEARRFGDRYRLTVPAGMTRQIWLDFRPLDVEPGQYKGQVVIQAPGGAANLVLPLSLHLYPFAFPSRPSVHVGGWDYLNGRGAYAATPENIPLLIPFLATNYIDTPWATSEVQPAAPQFDDAGKAVSAFNFDTWNEWTAKWPGANQYAVFLSVDDNYCGENMGTPRFNQMVAEMMNAWVNRLTEQGLLPEQLVILLLDEPTQPEQLHIIKTWAQAIKAAQPKIRLFEDPTYSRPEQMDPTLWPLIDVICPNLPMFEAGDQAFRDYYVAQQHAGRELWFYSCSGPAKLLDPVTYNRGQFWWAIRYGAKGSFYWAFGDETGGNSWNAYLQKHTQFSPLFIDQTSVTDSKQMAGIREGVQDYEYFVMLRNRIAELEAHGVQNPLLIQAQQLLTEAPDRVIAQITPDKLEWQRPKDRNTMDTVRIEVLEMLDKLSKL